MASWFVLLCLTILIIIIYALFRILFCVVNIESISMSPTLEDGDRVVVLRYWPTQWLKRGHVVIVWPWTHTHRDSSELFGVVPFIKRVVGLPGDTLITHIDELDNLHKFRPDIQAAHDREGKRVWQIPPNHFFVRGDYTLGGFDSLSWGPVPFSSFLGIVVMKLPRKKVAKYDQASYAHLGSAIQGKDGS